MKKALAVLCGFVVALAAVCGAFAVSTVSSHYPPQLVSEINTALANPSVTTLTIGTATLKIVNTTQLVAVVGTATNVLDADLTTP